MRQIQGIQYEVTDSVAESHWNEVDVPHLGCLGVAALRCRVALTVSSDERDKADITPIQDGLSFIRRVQPIQYVDNQRAKYLPEEPTEEQQDMLGKYGMYHCYDEKAHKKGAKKGDRKRVGVGAKQVMDALAEVYGSTDYANLVNDNLHDVKEPLPEGVESLLSVAYTNFVPFLIRAVQQLAERVEELEAAQHAK